MKKIITRVLPVIILAAVIGSTYIYLTRVSDLENGDLIASGTVEVVEVAIASEIPGRVSEVLVSEGTPIQQGDVLFRMDET